MIHEELSIKHEITAVQHAVESGSRPPLLIERPRLLNGAISATKVITNLTAHREHLTRWLGLPEHETAPAVTKRLAKKISPVDAPPERDRIVRAAEPGFMDDLPALWQHTCDPGPYLTAAHVTTIDPDTGIDNTAVQRVWVKPFTNGVIEWPFFPYPASHNRKNIEKWWSRGEDAPVALWIGHHPAVLVGSQTKVDYPVSHWPAAGAMAQSPIRLSPTSLHGERLKVPTEAEIVIEGTVPRGVRAAEGPFGEFTGFAGDATESPVIRVQLASLRRNAIYHDFGSGLADAIVPDNLLIEARLFEIAREVSDTVTDVSLPTAGRRFWAFVQTRDASVESVRRVIEALIEFRRTKYIVVVSEDVDIRDEARVFEAIATRSQPGRDFVYRESAPGSALDPSLAPGTGMTAKLGIDATWNNTRRPPRNLVPVDAMHSTAVRRAIESLMRQ